MPSLNARVVAGVSGDQPSVVMYALREAQRLGSSVRIVHCYAEHAGDVFVGSDPDEPTRVAGDRVLQQARTVVEDSPAAVEVEYVLAHGDAGAALLDESVDAASLVVGADDVNWLERMLGGEVSGLLALRAGCPVVVVPRAMTPESGADGVVVTLDGDTSAAGPLRYGFELAASRRRELHVLHATPAATSAADTAIIAQRVRAEVRRWNELTPQIDAQLSLTDGDSLQECIKATMGASLLVIGRPQGHSHLFALARPVAMLVLRAARCPVTIVPADYGARS